MTFTRAPLAFALLAACALTGCGANKDDVPGDRNDRHPFGEIPASETVRFTGTEPFWGGEVAGQSLVWKTPETPEGETVSVARFAGRGGLSFSGMLGGQEMLLLVTPGDCSDGMSDRHYPYVATVRLGETVYRGCAWTDARPYRADGPA